MGESSTSAIALLHIVVAQNALHLFNNAAAAELIAYRFVTFDGQRLVPTEAGRVYADSLVEPKATLPS